MSENNENSQKRKRGRPAGKGRVPLTAEQRRARNAQYERERREENTAALADLADAAGCSSNVPLAKLLETAAAIIKRSKKRKNEITKEQMIERNFDLMDEIAELEAKLGLEHGCELDAG